MSAKYWPHITGEYKVVLTNKVGSNEPVEGKTTQNCVIPCVEEINFTSDLSANKVLETIGEGEEATKQAILTVAFSSNEENVEKKYEWFKADASTDEYYPIAGANPGLTVAEPGFYKVKVTGTLNRESMYKWSSRCKVTNPIQAPVIAKYLVDGVEDFGSNGMIAVGSRTAGTAIDLCVEINELTELEADRVTYTWYRNTVTSDGIEQNGILVDKATQSDVLAVNDNHLQVKASGIDVYYCVIASEIDYYNGGATKKVAETVSDSFLISST